MGYVLTLLTILSVFCLGLVVYEDFRQRLIHWYWLPSVFILQAAVAYVSTGNEILYYILFNVGFILLQLCLLFIYFFIKNLKFTNIINKYIGIGDVLFFLAISSFFSPVNFIFFYIFSLVITILGFVILSRIKPQISNKIPLAGAMALQLIVIIGIDYIMVTFDRYTLNIL